MKNLNKTKTYLRLCVASAISMLLLIIATAVNAQDTESSNCPSAQNCVPQSSWQLGIAVGIGVRTNPLVDGDNIPLVVLPDIAYYGEDFYFDNGELGWQLLPSRSTSIELFIRPNTERANFSFWHPANVFIADVGTNTPPPPTDQPTPPDDLEVSIDDISKRNWAIDGGIRWQWHAENHGFKAAILHDISGTYKGGHVTLDYNYQFQVENWHIGVTPHLHWYSNNLTNYYYGISEEDTQVTEALFDAKGGVQFGLKVNATYQFSDDMYGLVRIGSKRLHSGMTDSPLVRNSSINTLFIGLAYRF